MSGLNAWYLIAVLSSGIQMWERVSTARVTSRARTICILSVTSRDRWRSTVDVTLCPIRRHLQRGLARAGVTRETAVVAYDDARQAFACRLWWLMRAAGYRPPRLLNGGYQAYLQAGGEVVTLEPVAVAAPVEQISRFVQSCDITGVREAQGYGALLIDSREPARYCGEEELIDPVAGHIPGALNRPWQAVTDDVGRLLDLDHQRAHWGERVGCGAYFCLLRFRRDCLREPFFAGCAGPARRGTLCR